MAPAVSATMLGAQVTFDVPVDVAYPYLADPRNRPEWRLAAQRGDARRGERRVGTSGETSPPSGSSRDGDHDAGAGRAAGRGGPLACRHPVILKLSFSKPPQKDARWT